MTDMVRSARWPRTLGIVGGLGPHAHLAFERLLLEGVEAQCDQDYPPWIVSSSPNTPDRTAALLDDGPSPVPHLVENLRRLERAGAVFAVIPCNTAHAFLPDVSEQVSIPVLDMIRETARTLADRFGPRASIGLLATLGTLRTGLYPTLASTVAPQLRWASLLDLPSGESLQQELVTDAIYGPAGAAGKGLKAGHLEDPHTGAPYAEWITRAAAHLRRHGCDAVVLGCTELPLAFGTEADDPRQIDPMRVAAERCLRIAAGEAPLPRSRP